MSTRVDARFEKLKAEGRTAFVAFITAGDPDLESSYELLAGLPGAGVDIIELGMPFTDPMADGPSVQASTIRALKAGQTMIKTLGMVRRFRADGDNETPIVLMGYYNPIYRYGVDAFLKDAVEAGVDGLIIVDLPPEEDEELCLPAIKAGVNFIRLATPTTDDKRLPAVVAHTTGFIYYVSITGITGAASAVTGDVEAAVARIRKYTQLPVVVGFGIKTPAQAAELGAVADGAVVGSAIVDAVRGELGADGKMKPGGTGRVLEKVRALANGAHSAQRAAAE